MIVYSDDTIFAPLFIYSKTEKATVTVDEIINAQQHVISDLEA